jgi:hypothetical protein
MRSLIIYSIFISAFLTIKISKRLEINQEACNDQKNLFFPVNLKFVTLVNDQDNIQVSASSMAPCDRIDDFKVEVVLNGIYTSMKFNSEDKMFSEALSRTAPMSFQETADWWNSFIKGFKSVVVGANITIDDNKVIIELLHMNPNLLMHLESLKIPFREGVYNYDIDAIMEERNPTKHVVVEQKMTPEMMNMFKQQLMNQEMMNNLLSQLKNGKADVVSTEKEGQKIEVIVSTSLKQKLDEETQKLNKDNQFLI